MRRKSILIALAVVFLAASAAWGIYYDATATRYLVRGLADLVEQSSAPGTPDSGAGRLYVKDNSGTMTLYFKDDAGTANNLLAGTATAWDDIGNPDAATSIDMTTYASTFDFGGTVDMFNLQFTGDFADVSGVVLEQKTGNPTDGTLLELKLADTDPDFLSLYRGSELYNMDSSANITAGTSTVTYTDWGFSADGVLTLAPDLSPADCISVAPSAAATDGIDVSDADLVNAVNIGANAIAGSNFSVTGAGAVTGTSLDNGDGNVTNVGNIALDSITADSSAITVCATAGQDTTVGNSSGDVALVSDDVDITLTDTTDNAFRINNSGGAVLMDISLGADDTITLGSGAEKFVLASSNIDISNAGAITGATGLVTSGLLSGTGTFSADGTSDMGNTTAGADVTIGNSTGDITMAGDDVDITLTDTTDNVFQIVNSGGAILLDIDLGATDAIDFGDASATMALVSADWGIDATGAMSNIGAITSDGAIDTTSTLQVDGDASLSDVTAGADVAIGNSTGDVALVSDDVTITLTDTTDDAFQIVNAGGPILVDIDLGAADAMDIGDASVTMAMTSSDWTISTTGDIANAGTIGSNGIYTFTGSAADSDAFKVDVQDSATGQYFVVDAGPWLGTAGEGAIQFTSDSGAVAEAGTVIKINLQGTSADAAAIDGKGLLIQDAAASTPGSYLVNLDSDNNGALHVTDGAVLLEDDAPLTWEGATADAYEAELDVEDPTADRTIVLPDYDGAVPLVIANDQTQTDASGVGTATDVTGSDLSLADGWFTAGKALKWTAYGTSDGSGGAAMSIALDVDGSQFGIVELTTSQSDDWHLECTLNEYTDAAHQKIVCTLQAEGESSVVEYDVDTTDFNDGGATTVKLVANTNHAADHIYVESVSIETWSK